MSPRNTVKIPLSWLVAAILVVIVALVTPTASLTLSDLVEDLQSMQQGTTAHELAQRDARLIEWEKQKQERQKAFQQLRKEQDAAYRKMRADPYHAAVPVALLKEPEDLIGSMTPWLNEPCAHESNCVEMRFHEKLRIHNREAYFGAIHLEKTNPVDGATSLDKGETLTVYACGIEIPLYDTVAEKAIEAQTNHARMELVRSQLDKTWYVVKVEAYNGSMWGTTHTYDCNDTTYVCSYTLDTWPGRYSPPATENLAGLILRGG